MAKERHPLDGGGGRWQGLLWRVGLKPQPVAERADHDADAAAPYLTQREIISAADGYEACYRAIVPRLTAFLMVQGASPETAADIVQETMMAAFRQWSTIKYPLAWTRRVASREYARRFASVDPQVAADGQPLFRLDSNTEMWEQRHDIITLLGSLPPRQRQVMAWTLNGNTPTEIAAELGIEPAAVRASLKKARRRLAALIRPSQEDCDDR